MTIVLTSINNPTQQLLTDRERELIHHLRVMLKDLPDDVYRSLSTLVEEQRGERWSDMQLLIYLNQAVADINAEPAHTYYTINDYPMEWQSCVITGAMIWSLIAEGIIQVGSLIRKFFTIK